MKIRLAALKGVRDAKGAAITVNVFPAFSMGKDKGKAGDRWPEGVSDDTAALGLRMGIAPEKAALSVGTWKRITAADWRGAGLFGCVMEMNRTRGRLSRGFLFVVMLL